MLTVLGKRFNWIDMMVYRLYYWRWNPIYKNDIELLKTMIAWMQSYVDAIESGTKEPG